MHGPQGGEHGQVHFCGTLPKLRSRERKQHNQTQGSAESSNKQDQHKFAVFMWSWRVAAPEAARLATIEF